MPPPKEALVVGSTHVGDADLGTLLEKLKYTVTARQDFGQAPERREDHRYDLVVVNASTPATDWQRVLNTVRSATSSPAIVIAARPVDEIDVRHALSAGAYLVLDGPLTATQMRSLISRDSDWLFVALR